MLAHFGVGIFVLGVVSVSAWEVERVDRISIGQTIEIAGYEIKKIDVTRRMEDNFVAEAVTFEVTTPWGISEKRVYVASQIPTTEAGILTYGFSQIYISLGDVSEDGSRVVRIWYKPFIVLIWLGTLFMAGAGFLSLSDRRLRIGVPKSARTVPEPAE